MDKYSHMIKCHHYRPLQRVVLPSFSRARSAHLVHPLFKYSVPYDSFINILKLLSICISLWKCDSANLMIISATRFYPPTIDFTDFQSINYLFSLSFFLFNILNPLVVQKRVINAIMR